jgi:hypothetical protein
MKDHEYYEEIDELSIRSRKLYDKANYIVRQEFFKTSKEVE